MLIKCPKCQATYKIENIKIPENGIKMRCHACSEVFKTYPNDILQEEPLEKSLQDADLTKMFERVSKATSNLFSDQLPVSAKVRVVHSTLYKYTINYFLILLVLALMGAVLCLMRYDVVRFVPQAEKLYDKLHMQSIYDGVNLQLLNIKTQEVIINNVSKIKLTGIINNPTPYEMFVLPLKVVVFDQFGNTLLDTTHYLPQQRTRPNYKLPFTIIINNPTPYKKNIQITFADNL
ncbi:MAG: zinc-ribbon domain-containing protein [Alphaproteobacteria bacterium]|nr:zinc-ribbon domain-containing protein [Alphaproteobacteria bacterium]